jgi:hypothetical protein
MLNLSTIWEMGFSAFEMFIAVGIVWLLWIEKLFTTRGLSVAVMIIVALAAAGLNFYSDYRKLQLKWKAAQKQIQETEDTEVEYEGEIA